MEQARSLIGERRFAEGLKVCEALLRAHTEEAEASVLAAACQLCIGCGEKEAKKLERIRKSVEQAFSYARSAEEIAKIETRLLSAMSRWRSEQLKAGLKKQEQKASLPELKNYFDLAAKYQKLPELIRQECAAAQEKLGIPGKIAEESPEKALEQELAQEEYDTARSVFGEAKMLVRFHGSGTSAQVSATLRSAIEMLTVAQVLASRSSAGCAPEDRCRSLEKEAEILYFGLSEMLHPDGQSLSLYCSGREEMITQLKALYEQIKELNPGFEAPELPGAAAVNTVPQKPGKAPLFGKNRKK